MNLTEEEKELVLEFRKNRTPFVPKAYKDYSPDELEDRFHDLHEFALDEFNHIRVHGNNSKDIERFAYEMIMGLLGTDVWDEIRRLID